MRVTPIGVAVDDPLMPVGIEDRGAVALAVGIGAFGSGHVMRRCDEGGKLPVGHFMCVDRESGDVTAAADALFRAEDDFAAVDAAGWDDALIVKVRGIHALHSGVKARRWSGAAAGQREKRDDAKKGLVGAAGFELATLSSQS